MATPTAADREAGMKAILYFHNKSQEYSNYPFKDNVEGLYKQINYISPNWLGFFGNGITWTKADVPGWFGAIPVQGIMEDLADELEGKAPANTAGLQLFYDALNESFSSITAKLKQIVQGAFIDTPLQLKEVATTAVKAFVWYKFLALGVAALGSIALIYSVMKKKKK